MFRKETTVVCIINTHTNLIYGANYKILGITYDNVEFSYYYRLYGDKNNGLYPIEFFVTPIEFRTLKIIKLKERINVVRL